MDYSQHIFCSDDISDALPEDEVDRLFSKLKKVEPPQAVIDHILSTVSNLPRPVPADSKLPLMPDPPAPPAPAVTPQPRKSMETDAADAAQNVGALPWDALDGLVVRREHCEPS